jgi:hypothetical protein
LSGTTASTAGPVEANERSKAKNGEKSEQVHGGGKRRGHAAGIKACRNEEKDEQ